MESTDVKILKQKLGKRYSSAVLNAAKYRVTRAQIVNFFNLRPVDEKAKEIIVKSAVQAVRDAEKRAKKLKTLVHGA